MWQCAPISGNVLEQITTLTITQTYKLQSKFRSLESSCNYTNFYVKNSFLSFKIALIASTKIAKALRATISENMTSKITMLVEKIFYLFTVASLRTNEKMNEGKIFLSL